MPFTRSKLYAGKQSKFEKYVSSLLLLYYLYLPENNLFSLFSLSLSLSCNFCSFQTKYHWRTLSLQFLDIMCLLERMNYSPLLSPIIVFHPSKLEIIFILKLSFEHHSYHLSLFLVLNLCIVQSHDYNIFEIQI